MADSAPNTFRGEWFVLGGDVVQRLRSGTSNAGAESASSSAGFGPRGDPSTRSAGRKPVRPLACIGGWAVHGGVGRHGLPSIVCGLGRWKPVPAARQCNRWMPRSLAPGPGACPWSWPSRTARWPERCSPRQPCRGSGPKGSGQPWRDGRKGTADARITRAGGIRPCDEDPIRTALRGVCKSLPHVMVRA